MQQEMAKLISSNKKAALNTAEGHMERLGQEIADLKRRDNELTQLSRTEDHIHFIQVQEDPLKSMWFVDSLSLFFLRLQKSLWLVEHITSITAFKLYPS